MEEEVEPLLEDNTPVELAQPPVDTDYVPVDQGGATIIADSNGIIYNQSYEGD